MTGAVAGRAPSGRLPALDLVRGIVMVLMAVDHSSGVFNAGRFFADSVRSWEPGTALPAAQFLLRWVSHLCAPTFVFLAGTSLAFSVRKELASGRTERDVDRYMLVRGALIVAFEGWVSLFLMPQGRWLFQVLYAIGASYIAMIALRRLPDTAALALAVVSMLGLEMAVGLALEADGGSAPAWVTLLVLPGPLGPLVVGYPVLHWLALMLLGWCLGRWLLRVRPSAPLLSARLLAAGALFLAVFAVVRGADGYGNMGLHRDDASLLQWLHVSKYPPSLSFDTLELGLAFLAMAALTSWSARRPPRDGALLLVLGQTPMFFYLLHFPLLVLAAKALGVEEQLGIGGALAGAAAVVVALYPACRWYRGYKAAHKDGWPRYI